MKIAQLHSLCIGNAACGRLEEVDANLRRGELLWRETGDGHGITLVVTDAGLLAIAIEPVVVKMVAAILNPTAETPEAKQPIQRLGTKQAIRIALLQALEGATMETIMVYHRLASSLCRCRALSHCFWSDPL